VFILRRLRHDSSRALIQSSAPAALFGKLWTRALIQSSALEAFFNKLLELVAVMKKLPSGAEARVRFAAFAARLKSCPDTNIVPTGLGFLIDSSPHAEARG
jgi:hypothetical protein